MCQKRAPAAAKMAIASAQTGHGVRKTNWPLWKMLAGYLNRSSNMSLRQRHIAICIETCRKEVGVTDWLKLAGKSTAAKPSLVEKHSTPALFTGVDWFDMQDMLRCLLAGVLLASPALAKTFTLEQVLSAPFPSELIAAPGGGKMAWLLNERGARNVWIASFPDFKGVRLTNYTQDDGQDVGQLRWTPDAKAVVYVRGGDLEFLGRPDPNPMADPAGVDQSIWIAAPGEAPRKLAAGHSPVVSPKGDRLAYLLGGQIWLAPLTGAGGPSLLIHARAGVTAGDVRWSPDGGKLAFVSDRANHSFIAVYDFASKSLSYQIGRA